MSGEILVYIAAGRCRMSDELIMLIQRNSFIKSMLKRVDIPQRSGNPMIDRQNYMRLPHRIRGVPAVATGPQLIYGRDAISYIQKLIKKNRPVVAGNIDGTNYIQIGEDEEVSFDPSKIKSQDDFIIPDNGNTGLVDIDHALAREEALRSQFDNEIKISERKY